MAMQAAPIALRAKAGSTRRHFRRRRIAVLGAFAFLLPLFIQLLPLAHCSIDDQLRAARGIPVGHHSAVTAAVAAPVAGAEQTAPHQHSGLPDADSIGCMVWLALHKASVFLAAIAIFILLAPLGKIILVGAPYRAPTLALAPTASRPRAPPLSI
jgi:hypothetical protein